VNCRVLIIGGYGNFGGYVARALASDSNIELLIGGRSQTEAKAFAKQLGAANPAEGCKLDIDGNLAGRLSELRPKLVIHTSGPFQTQDHRVARAAIAAAAHYLDLADARHFVATIGELDADARRAGVAVIAGASSVPCLTAAFVDRYRPRFGQLEKAAYGISAAQATNRGLGTAAAILSYVGKPFSVLRNDIRKRVFGWQGLHAVRYPELGRRLFGYCDVPDLEIFPSRYSGLRNLEFAAGHELAILHLGTWLLSWLVRLRLVQSLAPYAQRLFHWSLLFDAFGSDKSGFHMFLEGRSKNGAPMLVTIFMIARRAHGPNIPCMPAIILAKRIAAGNAPEAGARPCLDLIDLDELMRGLAHLDVTTLVRGPGIEDSWGLRSN